MESTEAYTAADLNNGYADLILATHGECRSCGSLQRGIR